MRSCKEWKKRAQLPDLPAPFQISFSDCERGHPLLELLRREEQ